jgi:hypothetical protein
MRLIPRSCTKVEGATLMLPMPTSKFEFVADVAQLVVGLSAPPFLATEFEVNLAGEVFQDEGAIEPCFDFALGLGRVRGDEIA